MDADTKAIFRQREKERLVALAPSSVGMVARFGSVIYWITNGLAVLLACLAALNLLAAIGVLPGGNDAWFRAIASLIFAGLIWSIGRAILYVLAAR